MGTLEEFDRSKLRKSQRGFTLRRLRDEFLCKPVKAPPPKTKKFINAKVTFNSGFGMKKDDGKKEDENGKTLTIPTGNNKFAKVWGQKFTDDNLKDFIQDYIRRKKENEDDTEQYTSLFCTTLSSIRSVKELPLEFIHNTDKEQRYLNNYEKARKDWKQRAVSLTHRLKRKSPDQSLMGASDAFAEMQVAKTGALTSNSSYYQSMNNWYGELRNNKKDVEKRSNFIQCNSGVFPIYVHETCHFRDMNIIKKPKELEMFKDNNLKNPCLKHLLKSQGDLKPLKVIERINSMGDLIVKGSNKFETEIDFIRRIPEDNRFIIKNMDEAEKPEDNSEEYGP